MDEGTSQVLILIYSYSPFINKKFTSFPQLDLALKNRLLVDERIVKRISKKLLATTKK
jgi:hypothetical protein